MHENKFSARFSFPLLEPQWRFETKLPSHMEADENNKIELECTVQDEDAECDWYANGEVSFIILCNKCLHY